MEFTRRVELDRPYDDTVPAVRAALAAEGFGILTEIDVQQTFKSKLDLDVEPQVILGACNPQLAHRALQAEPAIGALLPCNVVVRANGARTIIEALDPALIAEIPDNPALRPVAAEAGERIQRALDSLTTG